MTTFDYSLDSSPKTITPGFTIKQFTVENPSSYPIYVNISGLAPTVSVFDYIVQPNSTYISPEFTNSVICFVTSIVNDKIAKISLDSVGGKPSSNIPYKNYQFVGAFPGYPVTITDTNGFVNLPPFTVNDFDNILCLLSGVPGNNASFALSMFYTIQNLGYTSFIGYFPRMGGVINFSPPKIPAIFTPSLSMSNNPFLPVTNAVYEFNVIKTAESFDDVLVPEMLYQSFSVVGQTISLYFPVDAGFFVYEALVTASATSLVDISIDIWIGSNYVVGADNILIASYSFTGNAVTPDYTYIVSPKYATVGHPTFVRIDMTLNSMSPSQTIVVGATALSL